MLSKLLMLNFCNDYNIRVHWGFFSVVKLTCTIHLRVTIGTNKETMQSLTIIYLSGHGINADL